MIAVSSMCARVHIYIIRALSDAQRHRARPERLECARTRAVPVDYKAAHVQIIVIIAASLIIALRRYPIVHYILHTAMSYITYFLFFFFFRGDFKKYLSSPRVRPRPSPGMDPPDNNISNACNVNVRKSNVRVGIRRTRAHTIARCNRRNYTHTSIYMYTYTYARYYYY